MSYLIDIIDFMSEKGNFMNLSKNIVNLSKFMGIIYESNISGLTRNENFEKVKSTGCDPVLFLELHRPHGGNR